MGFEVEIEQLEAFEDYLTGVAQAPWRLRDYLAAHVCTADPYGVAALKPIGDFMAGEVLGWLDDFARLASARMAGTADRLQAASTHYASTDTAVEAGLARAAGAAA